MALINCPECGKEISSKVKVCPHCGYPLTEDELQPQPVEVVGLKGNSKKWIKVLSVIAIVIILGATWMFINKSNNEKKYVENLNAAVSAMYLGASQAETLCNLTAKVWCNSIYEKKDSQTDKYTRYNGNSYFYDDFNTALANLMKDPSTIEKQNNISNSQSIVSKLMKELQNPPDSLKNCYDTITELYSAYQGLTNLALNPTGSYTSFTSEKSEKVDEFIK